MARKGRRNNRKKVAAQAPAALPVATGLTIDALHESTDALEPAVPTQTAPVLPIEVIAMIAELLAEDDFTSWRALVAMTRLSRNFRTAALPVLVRGLDLDKFYGKFYRLLKQFPEAVIAHVRTAKLTFNHTLSKQYALLEKAGANLRALSLTVRSANTGTNAIRAMNASLSDRLESLELLYMPDMKDRYTPGRVALSAMPAKLELPSSLKKVAFQFIAEGTKLFANPMEEQIWRVVDKLPKLEEWSISIDPISLRHGSDLSLKDFPVSKAALLSEVSGSPRPLSRLTQIQDFAPRSVHVWYERGTAPWSQFSGWDSFAKMTSITRLTLEKISIDSPLLRALPKNLKELYILDFELLRTVYTPVGRNYFQQTVVDHLSSLPEFQLLCIFGFHRQSWFSTEELQRTTASWQDLQVPFEVQVKRPQYVYGY